MKNLIVGSLLAAAASWAQPIEVDWEAKAGPSGCPSEVSSRLTKNVVVRNINNILYRYDLRVTATHRSGSDLDLLSGIPLVPLAADPCQAKLEAAQGLYATLNTRILDPTNKPFLRPPSAADGKFDSVTLSDTLAAWNRVTGDGTLAKFAAAMDALKVCPTSAARTDLENNYAILFAMQQRVLAPHEVTFAVALEPDTDYKFLVTEYGGPGLNVKTRNGEYEFACKPESHILTLSGGVLATTIGDRDYTIVDVPRPDPTNPNNTLNSTFRALAVRNSSNVRPALVALLNYRLPIGYRDLFGLALSSGPAYKVAGNNQSSNLGYFAGVSLHLPRYRFFITPGVHLGEFADFPLGYSAGSFVPSSVTQVTPVKRWTLRFGISLTYKTNAFKTGQTGGNSTGSNQPTAGSAGGVAPAATAPPPQTPQPALGNPSAAPPAKPPTGTPPAGGNPPPPGNAVNGTSPGGSW